MDRKISLENRQLIELNELRRGEFLREPRIILPWLLPCRVKVLLVTDGGLDFGRGDFGLSTFVHVLLHEEPFYARFDVTLAHLRPGVSGDAMMGAEPLISRRISEFRFDDAASFTPEMYDQVWLFGIESSYQPGPYPARAADRGRYPIDRLGDGELRALSAHMNRGGGLFATGDHGALGRALCGSVGRIRTMRHWDSFTLPGVIEDEVSMVGSRRNDTTEVGHDPGSQFSDQSDDIPQRLDLKLYSTSVNVLQRARYPHPVLCGRTGRIDVLPDHPHEGECQVPPNTTLTMPQTSDREYPDATDGSGAVIPELIAWAHVGAGSTASVGPTAAEPRSSKIPTVAHSFGSISAYDGHRAGVGRVLCDATWHHFVNVNLIGVVEGAGFDQFDDIGRTEDVTKHDGFLSSPAGRVALNRIKNYYTNIAVWIAPPSVVSCFRSKFWWRLVYKDRIMEATLVDPDVAFEKIPVEVFLSIGIHARDVLGRGASQCQSLQFVLDWIRLVWVEVLPWIDPWDPMNTGGRDIPMPLPSFDPRPMIDVALGAALVSLRQAFPYPPEEGVEKFEDRAREITVDGARRGLAIAAENLSRGLEQFRALLDSVPR